jgi:hypothetical protein
MSTTSTSPLALCSFKRRRAADINPEAVPMQRFSPDPLAGWSDVTIGVGTCTHASRVDQ